MATIRKSLASLWDTADEEAPPPLRRSDAKQGIDKVKNLDMVKGLKLGYLKDINRIGRAWL